MLGISCLVKNTSLRDGLNNLIEYVAYTRISKGLPAGIADIYNDIRKAGIEVDLQTAAHIYNDVLPKNIDQFDNDNDVNEFALKNYTDAIERAAALIPPSPEEGQIGKDAPEISVVDRMLNMFYNANTQTPAPQFSDMRTMQEALWNGIKRKLDMSAQTPKPVNKEGWKTLLNKAIGYENLGLTDINGQLNGIADLYEAMKRTLDVATADMEEQGDYATAEKWRSMVDDLQASTYSYLFSKPEASTFIKTIMNDAGYGKVSPKGTISIDFNKLSNDTNSIKDLRDNVDRVMRENGFNDAVIKGVKDSFENEFNNLHAKVLQYRMDTLANKEESLNKPMASKSDLRRLAELNNLGIFQSAHDRLLNSVIGISDLQSEDLADLEQLAKAASNLYREIDKNYGSDVYASFALQAVQRNIDRILQRNINNKSTFLKIVAAIKNFFDIYLTGLLMGPLTIMENWISGVKEIGAPMFLGKGKALSTEDKQLYSSVLLDVLKRGQSFGEEVGSFAPRELYSNTLQYKWKDATKTELAESVLNVLMTPARVGLLGFDSANKAVITNKVFHNTMYAALKKLGKTDEQAKNILNEALHGKSFEKAKEDAEKIIVNLNKDLPLKAQLPVNNATIVRLANDLVKANLNSDDAITNTMIESVLKGSYHVAGYGLGHEPNNLLSKMVKGARDNAVKKESELLQSKDWNALARHRLMNTFVNGVVLKFTGGATNWIFLRAQSGLGLGLATGFMGKWDSNKVDFENKDDIKRYVKEVQGARNQIGRALVGLSYTALGYAILYGLTMGGGDDEEKKKRLAELKGVKKPTKEQKEEIKSLESQTTIYRRTRANYEGNRLFKKIAPDVMLINYYRDTYDSDFTGILQYVKNTGGIASDYSVSKKIENAIGYYKGGEAELGNGELAGIAGQQIGVPVWRAYKEYFKLISWISGNSVSSDFKKPSNVAEGLFGGGALEDLGFFSRNSSITILPGIGPKAIEKFKTKGINRMEDVIKNPDWYNATFMNEETGNETYILNEDTRKRAKEAADKWIKDNQ